ncbi:MAG: acylglycerol kinase family protein [Lawsonibacter sp.]
MEPLLLIYNPTAGKGQLPDELAAVLDEFTKANWLVTAYPTQGKGDAVRAARELGPRFSRLVCAGGDGTLSETVTGLMQLEKPPILGYIPFGSTNDCAANLGLPASPVRPPPSPPDRGSPGPATSASSMAAPSSMWPPSGPLPRWPTRRPRT